MCKVQGDAECVENEVLLISYDLGVVFFIKKQKEIIYSGWIVRIFSLRERDTICKEGIDEILLSEVIEEGVSKWKVVFIPSGPKFG